MTVKGSVIVREWRDAMAKAHSGPKIVGIPTEWMRDNTGQARWYCERSHLLTRAELIFKRATSETLPDEALGTIAYCKVCQAKVFTLPSNTTREQIEQIESE